MELRNVIGKYMVARDDNSLNYILACCTFNKRELLFFFPSTAIQLRSPKHKRYSFRKLERTFIIHFFKVKRSFAAHSYSWVCFYLSRYLKKSAMSLKWCAMAMFMFSLSIMEKHMSLIQPHWNLKFLQQKRYQAEALNIHLHIDLLVRYEVVFSSTWLMSHFFASCCKYTTTIVVFILIKCNH